MKGIMGTKVSIQRKKNNKGKILIRNVTVYLKQKNARFCKS